MSYACSLEPAFVHTCCIFTNKKSYITLRDRQQNTDPHYLRATFALIIENM